jgi:NAD(P)H-flavin reductase
MGTEIVARVRDVQHVTPRACCVQLDFGGRAFRFAAGQSVNVGLLPQATRKPYSIASSPEQVRTTGCLDLIVGTDEDGRLGPHLEPLAPGSVVGVGGPIGGFALPSRAGGRPLLFVAGGTGIVPLRSMLWSAISRLSRPVVDAVYSARTPAEFIFDAELRRLHRSGRIRYVRTVTRPAGTPWAGRRGRIDETLLRRVRRPNAVCFVCGPDGFVRDVSAMLRSLGVRASQIRRDEY